MSAGNDLGPEGGAAIAEALTANKTLHTLDLGGECGGVVGAGCARTVITGEGQGARKRCIYDVRGAGTGSVEV